MPQRLDTRSPAFGTAFAALLASKREAAVDVDQAVGDHRRCRRRGRQGAHRLFAKIRPRRSRRSGACCPGGADRRRGRAAAPEALAALRLAHERITVFHERQRPSDQIFTDALGVELGWRWEGC